MWPRVATAIFVPPHLLGVSSVILPFVMLTRSTDVSNGLAFSSSFASPYPYPPRIYMHSPFGSSQSVWELLSLTLAKSFLSSSFFKEKRISMGLLDEESTSYIIPPEMKMYSVCCERRDAWNVGTMKSFNLMLRCTGPLFLRIESNKKSCNMLDPVSKKCRILFADYNLADADNIRSESERDCSLFTDLERDLLCERLKDSCTEVFVCSVLILMQLVRPVKNISEL